MGLYFEELNVGDEWVTPSRTVTEADIVQFACLTGDFNPLHTDEEWCKRDSPAGTRIAHGLLTVSYAIGLLNRLPVTIGTTLAFLESNIKLPRPVFPGDTITVRQRVVGRRETSKPDRGVVTFSVVAVNQRGETVMDSTLVMMMARRPQGQAIALDQGSG
jgi:acyl dehydratase